jgi:hypothetical protein
MHTDKENTKQKTKKQKKIKIKIRAMSGWEKTAAQTLRGGAISCRYTTFM